MSTPASTADTLPVSPDWGRASANVVAHLDDETLPRHLMGALATIARFEFASCFVYRGRSRPLLLFDTCSDAKAKQGLANYVSSTFVLNPVYNAYIRGLQAGVYRIREVAPDAYFQSAHLEGLKVRVSGEEEIGYLTDDWPAHMEEVVLMLQLPDGAMGEISLSQPMRGGGFTEHDIAALAGVLPFVEAVFRRFWQRGGTAPAEDRGEGRVEEILATLGNASLSPREREVAGFILRGHSSLSTGLHLGISATTVKTHRKNLYAKLGIASHYELFKLFLDATARPA